MEGGNDLTAIAFYLPLFLFLILLLFLGIDISKRSYLVSVSVGIAFLLAVNHSAASVSGRKRD